MRFPQWCGSGSALILVPDPHPCGQGTSDPQKRRRKKWRLFCSVWMLSFESLRLLLNSLDFHQEGLRINILPFLIKKIWTLVQLKLYFCWSSNTWIRIQSDLNAECRSAWNQYGAKTPVFPYCCLLYCFIKSLYRSIFLADDILLRCLYS